jgi:hypothetical protein
MSSLKPASKSDKTSSEKYTQWAIAIIVLALIVGGGCYYYKHHAQ